MRDLVKVVSTVVVTAVLTSAFWILTYNIVLAPRAELGGKVAMADDKATVDRGGASSAVIAEAVPVGPDELGLPLPGITPSQLVDTFTQAREAGERVHDAIDILAPAGTPVIASAGGKVEKLFYSQGGGGITAYVRSNDGRWIYYYAHLQSYAPGLVEGQKVARGQLIARVGSTGNASRDGPHLHFAIHRMSKGEDWWKGTPINPYPLLARRS